MLSAGCTWIGDKHEPQVADTEWSAGKFGDALRAFCALGSLIGWASLVYGATQISILERY